MAKEVICTVCGSSGQAKTVTRGNMLIELALWLFFLVPGLIYSVWRLSSRYKACAACGNKNIVPVDSPIGKKLASGN